MNAVSNTQIINCSKCGAKNRVAEDKQALGYPFVGDAKMH
jgi:hypothetical protein